MTPPNVCGALTANKNDMVLQKSFMKAIYLHVDVDLWKVGRMP